MLQNASYEFSFFFKKRNKTKQNYEKKKKSHPAGVESNPKPSTCKDNALTIA